MRKVQHGKSATRSEMTDLAAITLVFTLIGLVARYL